MGFGYLEGKRWSEVTRDERFFCARLLECIKQEGADRFVAHLRDDHALDVAVGGEWEAAFEVCFYRDLWHHRGRPGRPYSPKRTFDLCLFGESAIIIVEAKAAENFEHDQTHTFARDINEVRELTGIESIHLVGLCSSSCKVDPELGALFTGPILRWRDLARRYDNDTTLVRADDIYEPKGAFGGVGKNSDARMSGRQLLEAFEGRPSWWVGRGGGLAGSSFADDVATGDWRERVYEVNTQAAEAPTRNYFSLADFVRAISRASTDGTT